MRALGRALLIATFVMNAMGTYAFAAEPTKTTIAMSPAGATAATATITFTAFVGMVNGGAAVTTGDVVFRIDGAPQPPVALSPSGTAAVSTAGRALGPGLHTIAADYQGAPDPGGFTPSTASITILLNSPIDIGPFPLPGGVVGQPYSVQLTASGGVAPYSFKLVDGVFPAGLSLALDGLISGTPTNAFNYNFGVVATDSTGLRSSKKTLNLKVTAALPSVSTGQIVVVEGNSGTTSFGLDLVLSGPATQQITVSYTTRDGTAVAGSDYVSTTGAITFLVNDTHRLVPLQVIGDLVPELKEDFFLDLTGATNATIATPSGRVVIEDDDKISFTVTVSGAGRVVSDPPGIDCGGGTCSAGFGLGTVVSLTTLPGQGATFAGWTGACAGTGSCVITVTGPIDLGATFKSNDHTLTVTRTGTGSGVVTSSPIAIDCGATCSASFTSGSIVTLTATPDATSTFAGWSGACSGTGTCTVTMDASKSVTATFARQSYTLTVTRTGGGTVTSDPVSIYCGATCASSYTAGTVVTLTATPDATATFTGWGGACTGTGLCTVTMNAPKTVDAAFSHTLTVSTTGTGSGTVTSTPAGIDCGSTCTASFAGDSVVTLTATPDSSSTFAGWSGACAGTGSCTLTMDAAKSATATFAATTTTRYTGPLTGIAGEPIDLTATVTSASGRVVIAGSVTFTIGQASTTAPIQNGLARASLVVTSPGIHSGTVAYTTDDGFGLSQADFQITIDPEPVASISDSSTYEGDSGVTIHSLTVTLSRASTRQIQLSTRETRTSTATAHSDFDMQPAIILLAGETSRAFEIRVYGDTIYEADETVEVMLGVMSGNVSISSTNGIGTLTILNDDAPPQVSIVDKPVALYEGDSGTTAFDFAVTLSAASSILVAVDYSTVDGTATSADLDYRPLSGTVTFLPGETLKTITVQAVGDLRYETDEDFTVTLSRPHNATLGAATGTGQILNDDKVPSLSVATKPVALYEGNAGTTAFDFTVTLSAASSLDVTVIYAAVGGTARAADGDFTATGGTLTFLAGETLKTITVPVIGDLLFEADEDFTVVIAFPTNATIASDTGYGTILNDDVAPVVRVQTRHHSVTEGNSGLTPVDITLELSAATGVDTTVTWSTRDGTAVALADYTGLAGTATLAAGTTTATLTVNVIGELVYEADQQFAVDLRFATNATIDATNDVAVVTIVNDDSPPEIVISETRADEGDSGPTPLTFAITLTNASDEPVEVDYQTSDVVATVADGDYRAAAGTFTFAPGSTAGAITVIVNGDLTYEGNEMLQLALTAARGGTIASPRDTVGFISNDDAIPTVRTAGGSFDEGTGGTRYDVQTVTLSNPSDRDIYVRITLRDGTAVKGSDYHDPVDSVLIFRAGDVSESTLIPWVTDSLDEDDETYGIELDLISGIATIGGSAVSRIVDDDDPPYLAIRSATQAEGDAGTIMLPFDITLSAPSGRIVTVDFQTTAGTATSGVDYQALTYTVTFPPGVTRVEANVRVYGDTTGEADETLSFSVTGLTNATLGAVGTITIENDDLPSVRLVLPADGAVYVVGQDRLADGTWLAVDYRCTNAISCSGTSAVGTAIDTSSVGTRTFTATAVDAFGNLATVTHTYRVAYAFGGFLDPIQPGRTYRLGSTIPIKFALRDADGAPVSTATARIFAYKVIDYVPDEQPTETGFIEDDQTNRFRWVDDHYQYNLGTKLFTDPGLYVIFVDLEDGSVYKTTLYLKR